VKVDARRARYVAIGVLSAGLVVVVGCGTATTSPSSSTRPAVSTSLTPPSPSGAPSPAAQASAPNVVASICTPTPIKFDPKVIDLTGAWAGDDDGVYYVRQRGSAVWWNGMSSRDGRSEQLGREWDNVGHGQIKNLEILADWVDVPRGGIDGYGKVGFKIGADSTGNLQLTETIDEGTGRGDTRWTRCQPGFYR
jgi:hypothetical protein